VNSAHAKQYATMTRTIKDPIKEAVSITRKADFKELSGLLHHSIIESKSFESILFL
jgi:hypothetical protein